jgi:hypothetical protein
MCWRLQPFVLEAAAPRVLEAAACAWDGAYPNSNPTPTPSPCLRLSTPWLGGKVSGGRSASAMTATVGTAAAAAAAARLWRRRRRSGGGGGSVLRGNAARRQDSTLLGAAGGRQGVGSTECCINSIRAFI